MPTKEEIHELISPLLRKELDKIKRRVLTKDRDYVCVIDGEEGVGKSVTAMHLASYFDPNFCIDNICFTADDFIKIIRDPNTRKGTAIVMDEAFASANNRASLSEVNRAMIAVATEMRQKNLFVIMVIPSFFDLDRYFALWRCRSLFHLYFTPEEDRRFIIFPKDQKKLLYLNGKKQYNYSKPHSPFPPFNCLPYYVVDEVEYRKKKANAFGARKVTNQGKKWLGQRNALLTFLAENTKLNLKEICEIPKLYNQVAVDTQHISDIMIEMNKFKTNPYEIEVLTTTQRPLIKTDTRLTE